MNKTDPVLLTVAAAAEMLTVSVPTLRRMIAAGRTPQPVRLGRALRFRRADLLQWVEDGCPSRREVRR
jgi:excisionase family DNA binding protein